MARRRKIRRISEGKFGSEEFSEDLAEGKIKEIKDNIRGENLEKVHNLLEGALNVAIASFAIVTKASREGAKISSEEDLTLILNLSTIESKKLRKNLVPYIMKLAEESADKVLKEVDFIGKKNKDGTFH